jgi:hypothetical protein
LELADNADFNSPLVKRTLGPDTQYTVETPLPPGKKYWRVSADPDSAAWSDTDDFIISTSPDILAFTPDSTPNRRPTLRWKIVVGATSYKILIADSADFRNPLVSQTVTALSFRPDHDLTAGRKFWKVSSDYNYDYYSLPNAFTIAPELLPKLIHRDPDPSSERRPILSWQPVNHATYYIIEIDTNPSFANPIVRAKVEGKTTFQPESPLPEAQLLWRVSSSLDTTVFAGPEAFILGNPVVSVTGKRLRYGAGGLAGWRPPAHAARALLTGYSVTGHGRFEMDLAASQVAQGALKGLRQGAYIVSVAWKDASGQEMRIDRGRILVVHP